MFSHAQQWIRSRSWCQAKVDEINKHKDANSYRVVPVTNPALILEKIDISGYFIVNKHVPFVYRTKCQPI